MRVKEFTRFIQARERHRKAKLQGNWTGLGGPDGIIMQYRFCNVRRNDDRVTKYVLEHFLPRYDNFKWFAAAVARLFNSEEVLDDIASSVVPFKLPAMRNALHRRKAAGLKNFNPAYIVSTNGRAMDKVQYVLTFVLAPLWEKRVAISKALEGATLEEAHFLLKNQNGLGSFMAAQVLADIKYTGGKWRDFDTFAASGPGSKRGLNRVMGEIPSKARNETDFRRNLLVLREATNKALGWDEPLTAQDVQNCLCEFDKYERVRLGEGRPKQLYKPKEK